MRNDTSIDHDRLRRRAASLAIAAAFGIAAATPMAAIVDSGVVNIPIPQDLSGIYMNWVTGVTGTSEVLVPGWDFNPYGTGAPALYFWTRDVAPLDNMVVGPIATRIATALVPGDVIGPASSFINAGRANGNNFWLTGTEYVGINFKNEATGITNYGYAQLQTTGATGFPATITRYVYENTGLPIMISGAPPVQQAAFSRKVQGGGTYDLPLP